MRGREKITLKFMAFTTGESRTAQPFISIHLSLSLLHADLALFIFAIYEPESAQVKPKEAEKLPPPPTPPPSPPSTREFFALASDIRK